jgi:hypothetical protein
MTQGGKMNAITAMLVTIAIGWFPAAMAAERSSNEQAVAPAGAIVVAQDWRDKLEAIKRKEGQTKPGQKKDKGRQDEKEDELPAGDCVTYPIGCGPGYANPKLRGIDCGGRSEIGCLCWKNLASKQECDAYSASKKKKK